MIRNNNGNPLSSAFRLTSTATSSINNAARTHATSIFHAGEHDSTHATTSIFRVGNPYFNARTSVAQPQAKVVSHTRETDEEIRDHIRYAYARKVMKRKQLARSLKGIVDEDSYTKITNNSLSSGDLRKIRVQIDEGTEKGALTASEGKKLKYSLGEL